jgi:molybdate transport system ATP-binding protein
MGLDMRVSKQLAHFNLELEISCKNGEILALVGPSGSGKTTVIRILAGLEYPDSGLIRLHDRILCDIQPDSQKIWMATQKRKLGYVFQEASLFPHLNVRDNIRFGCTDSGEISALLDLLEISHLADKKPKEISGGERQRAALAQALAAKPELLLLDEPLSALDIQTRQSLREKLLVLKDEFQIPIILVTHDLEEAALLGDQIVSIEQGRTDTDWLQRLSHLLPQ